MSDHDENPQPAEELETPSPAETPETDDTTDTDDTTPARGNEAARYRVERNQARAALAEARTQIENLQRAAIEQLCAAASVQPRALWLTTELSDLVNDDGTVNTEAVSAALGRARDELGIEIPQKGALAPRAGYQPATPPPTKTQWADAFTPRNRRADR